MKVLTVDDHPVALTGISQILASTFPGCEVWTSGRTQEAIRLAVRIRPDLILLDLHLPEPPSAAETCKQLQARGVGAPVVLFTAHDDDSLIEECLAAGAAGCLLKDTATATLAAGLRRAVRGQSVIDPRVRRSLEARRIDLDDLQAIHLTSRETEILGLVAEGLANREIGARLGVAESTVKWHVRKVMEKLDARSRWQAVVSARERGLL